MRERGGGREGDERAETVERERANILKINEREREGVEKETREQRQWRQRRKREREQIFKTLMREGGGREGDERAETAEREREQIS